MTWILASIPFWIVGLLFGASAFICAIDGINGKYPVRASVESFLVGMALCGVLFYLAAMIAS
jgi:hypothetical protein